MTASGIHVVFGTGAAGLAVLDELVRRGLSARAVNRSGKAEVPEGVKLVRADAGDSASTGDAVRGAAAVYQCMNVPYHRPERFPPLQRTLLQATTAQDAVFVSFENVYMYGPPPEGGVATEDLPYDATTKKGRMRAAIARELLDAHEAGRARVVTGRAADYFGPRAVDQSFLGSRVVWPALDGKRAQVVGDPDQPHSFTYVKDIARGLVTLAVTESAHGRAWHLPNAPARTTRELVRMIYAEAGHAPKLLAAGPFLVRLMGLFDPTIRELVEMMYEKTRPFIVDSSRIEEELGLAPTPFEESIPETVEWFRRNPRA